MAQHPIPSDVAREKDTLGVALRSPKHAHDLAELGRTEYFSLDSHRKIFDAIKHLVDAGNEAIDELMVIAELERRGQLQDVGGAAYVADLSTSLVVLAIPQSKRIARLKELAQRRALQKLGYELSRRAVDPTEDVGVTNHWLIESAGASL